MYSILILLIIIRNDNSFILYKGEIILDFKDMTYTRPDLKALESEFDSLLREFKSSETFEEQNSAMGKINALRNNIETMEALSYNRYTINTEDKFYEEERAYFDKNLPIYEGMKFKYYEALVNSKFRKQLEENWGKQVFTLAELSLKTFSPEVIEDLQLENKLVTDYVKLLASAKIMFQGEERTLAQMVPFQQSRDRAVRKSASDVRYNFFRENEEKFDDIYDSLVKVRTTIAKKLGFNNFIELAYARMRNPITILRW